VPLIGTKQPKALPEQFLGLLGSSALLELDLAEELRQGLIAGFLCILVVGLAFPGLFEGLVEHTDQIIVLITDGWSVLGLQDLLLLPVALQLCSFRTRSTRRANTSFSLYENTTPGSRWYHNAKR
jgi:hypothetical protein